MQSQASLAVVALPASRLTPLLQKPKQPASFVGAASAAKQLKPQMQKCLRLQAFLSVDAASASRLAPFPQKI
ncbi:hypothetical protein ABE493_18185 [Stenotrophomonas terrae]|uniref:hypothetical protein n=1 Tax=Stenotrophomonas terrae TaxID=405446 RepID=UPI0032088724